MTIPRVRPASCLALVACLGLLAPPLLAEGDVDASLRNGRLVLRGDQANNRVLIEQSAPGVIDITGLGGTTVNGLASVTLAGVDGNITIRMRGGADLVSMVGVDVPKNLRVSMGTEPDTVELTNVTVGGKASINMSRGPDAVRMLDVEVTRSLRVKTGPADDVLEVTSTTVHKNVRVNSGGGQDDVDFIDATVDQKLSVRMRKGDDGLGFTDSTVKRLRASGGKGTDALLFAGTNVFDKIKTKKFEANQAPG